ncbi:hypothetical protein C8Q74DRAFT_1233493 [Fomes fomentarius]|nr:hypothetical protein C8Q74DRAFT_1233493 [Fomes fomentarius]
MYGGKVSAVWALDCLQMALYLYTVAHYLVYAHNDLLGQSMLSCHFRTSGVSAVKYCSRAERTSHTNDHRRRWS